MTYGRNFEFLVPPRGGQRAGRYATDPKAAAVPIGAPVAVDVDAAVTDLGLQPVDLVTGSVHPVPGLHGIAVYEYGPAAFAGTDPFLTTYSDLNTIPAGKACQVVSGLEIKVVLRNLAERLFLNERDYAGFVMVDGLGATPTVAVGDFLVPGPGDSTSGYWSSTDSETDAWLVITGVDATRGEVEARFVF